jgi:hypothetical protein
MGKMKVSLFVALGFGAGVVVGMVAKGSGSTPEIEAHWKVVREFKQLIENPRDYEVHESLGMISVEIRTDPIPSLYALASAGEIEHVDIVLPNVPAHRDANRLWMTFCEDKEGIIYATGNPSFTDFKIDGVQPIHLNIWFEERAKADVLELIDLLDKTQEDE